MLQVNWDVWISNPSGLPFRETVVVTVTEQENDSHETARLTISCDRRPVCWNPLLMRPEWDPTEDGPKAQTVPMRSKIPWQLYRLIKEGENPTSTFDTPKDALAAVVSLSMQSLRTQVTGNYACNQCGYQVPVADEHVLLSTGEGDDACECGGTFCFGEGGAS